jgi:hypothetical protein
MPPTDSAPDASSPEAAVQSAPRRHGAGDDHRALHCADAPAAIAAAFTDFDAATTPPPAGQPASVVLSAWLAHLDPNVVFEAGNAAPLVGRAAVAGYFDPLLPALGSVVHDLDTVSPVCGADNAWSVRGTLLLTRRSDGNAIPPIPFTDTLFFDDDGDHIVRYEIRFDPTPIGLLFAP